MPVKASAAAAKAIAANPEASNRAIAAKVGVDEGTVRKARGNQLRNNSAIEKRIGLDGKARKMPAAKVETFSIGDFDEEDGVTAAEINAVNAEARRRVFMRCALHRS